MRSQGRFAVVVLVLLAVPLVVSSCREGSDVSRQTVPAEGTSAEAGIESDTGSERTATELADCILDAYGGEEAWRAVRYVSWINRGQRLQAWDKETGDLRVENEITVVLMNLGTRRGRAWKYGEEIVDPEARRRALDYAYEAFRLDSHEFLLPFLLRGEDFVLHDHGRGELDGAPVDVLGVTFTGDEPYAHAEYRLLLDPRSCRIRRFLYYMDAGDPKPRFAMPWGDHEWFDGILLALGRGQERHTHVRVGDEMPASVFESPEPVPWLRDELDESPE